MAYLMIITEKCDVYNLGVVAIETLMGRHPKEFLSLLSSSPSTSKFTSTQNMFLIDILVQRIQSLRIESAVAHGVLLISAIAFACLRANPKCQPTTETVCKQLVSHHKRAHRKGAADCSLIFQLGSF